MLCNTGVKGVSRNQFFAREEREVFLGYHQMLVPGHLANGAIALSDVYFLVGGDRKGHTAAVAASVINHVLVSSGLYQLAEGS